MKDVYKFILTCNAVITGIDIVTRERPLMPEALEECIATLSDFENLLPNRDRIIMPDGSYFWGNEVDELLRIIRAEIQPLDQVARRALLLNINREILFHPFSMKYEKQKYEIEDIFNDEIPLITELGGVLKDKRLLYFCRSITEAAVRFIHGVSVIAGDFEIEVDGIAPLDNNEKTKHSTAYKRLPRSQCIAVINLLLRKLDIKEGVVDNTKIAEFIEAVTGGNVETKGKDTYAYSHLSDELKPELQELLGKIGL